MDYIVSSRPSRATQQKSTSKTVNENVKADVVHNLLNYIVIISS